MIVGGGSNQVALVAGLGEIQVPGEIIQVDLEVRQFFDQASQVGPAREPVEMAEHRVKIVGHDKTRNFLLEARFSRRSRPGQRVFRAWAIKKKHAPVPK